MNVEGYPNAQRHLQGARARIAAAQPPLLAAPSSSLLTDPNTELHTVVMRDLYHVQLSPLLRLSPHQLFPRTVLPRRRNLADRSATPNQTPAYHLCEATQRQLHGRKFAHLGTKTWRMRRRRGLKLSLSAISFHGLISSYTQLQRFEPYPDLNGTNMATQLDFRQ